MTKEEAIDIIEDFKTKAGCTLFIDGCTGLSDKDLITIAENCQKMKVGRVMKRVNLDKLNEVITCMF